MSGENNLMKFICPLLAALATVIALFGSWFTRTTQVTERTIDTTLLEILRGTSFVEYASTQWIWISGAGLLIVLASAVVGDQHRKRLAGAGSYLLIALPAFSLLNVFAGDEDLDAGWAMWAALAIVLASIVLSRKIPEAEAPPANIAPVE